MKRIAIYALPIALLALSGCKKEDSPTVPTVTTAEVTSIGQNTAIGGGGVKQDQYGDVTAEGICWGTSPKPTVEGSKAQITGVGLNFTADITGLAANTTYYVRAYATNSVGIGYGNEVMFTTLPATLPVLSITNPGLITQTTATFDLEVASDGGEAPTRGVCWGTSENPTISDSKTVESPGSGAFITTITGLTPNTTYYARAYATNAAGTAYGNNMLVRTMYGTVTDIDGNVYQTVLIGNQEWMAENLKVTHYRNGDAIPNVTNENQWDNLVTGAYCNYENNESYVAKYGRLYNWYAVSDSRNLALEGWHVATHEDWNILESYLGGSEVAGAKLKASNYPLETFDNANNSSGFTGRLGGKRDHQIQFSFYSLEVNGLWWTSTAEVSQPGRAYRRAILINDSGIGGYGDSYRRGYSVRCIKD